MTITPLDRQYFGVYTCKAENPHGEAFQEIELHEAREPSYVQQVSRIVFTCGEHAGQGIIICLPVPV